MTASVLATLSQHRHQREQRHLLRYRPLIQDYEGVYLIHQNQRYLQFCHNDYLGLRHHPQLINAWHQGLDRWGSSASASPMLTGYCQAHQKLEHTICQWLGFEDALLFSCGFSANQTALLTLLKHTHYLWQDRLNHASLQEAGFLSPARMQRFLHNDMVDLEKQLIPDSGLIVSEGIFSMDGDCAPWPSLLALAHKTNNLTLMDDAHGLGVYGKYGAGTCQTQQIKPDLYMATFGKALGGAGAFIAGRAVLIDALRQFGRGYLYSTHMPPAQAQALTCAIQLTQNADAQRDKLDEHSRRIRNYFHDVISYQGPATPIIPLVLGSVENACFVEKHLREQGIWCQAIRPPTVPENSARLRITLSAQHDHHHIQQLIDSLEKTLCLLKTA